MEPIISSYNNDLAEVVLFKNEDGSFCVLRRTRCSMARLDLYKFKVWNYTDLDFASAKYTDCIDLLNGKPARCNCCFYPKNIRRCKAKQCPKKLGGEDYWRLFREACLFRTR